MPDAPAAPRTFQARVAAREELSPDVSLLRLTLVDPPLLLATAGQFVMLHVPQPGGASAKRAYSLVDAPADDGASELTLCVKLLPGGRASAYVAGLRAGAPVELSGPFGRFGLSPAPLETPRLFIGTGVGVAPFVGMAQHARRRGASDVTALLGFRQQQDIVLRDALARELGVHRVLVTLSQPQGAWDGLRGRVTAHLPGLVAARPDAEVSLCGSPAMVEECRALLVSAGLPANRIRFEVFASPGHLGP